MEAPHRTHSAKVLVKTPDLTVCLRERKGVNGMHSSQMLAFVAGLEGWASMMGSFPSCG